MATKNIIIGASAAGIACAKKLRELDKDVDIFVIDAEESLPCNRCLLSDLLEGDKTEQDVTIKDSDYFREQNINLMLQTRVLEVLSHENSIRLQNGQKLFYDKLFLGTGKTGFIPNISGSDIAGVFSFYGLSDVKAILSYIESNKIKHITVVGAGLTGLECADALHNRGFEVALVERAQQVLPYQMDSEGASILRELILNKGISLYLGQVIDEIRGDERVREIILSDEDSIKTDLVIFSIGGKPNIQIALRAGIDTSSQGILTKTSQQTSCPDIFAGGDSCAVQDLVSGKRIQSCLWTEAALQGIVAAYNMLGFDKQYPGAITITSSKIFGTPIATCGITVTNNDDYEITVKSGSGFYQKYLTQGQVLVGFVMIGKVENVGLLRKYLSSKTPFSPDEFLKHSASSRI